MAYSKTNWNEGTVTKAAHVTIDGTEYPVTPATVNGGTPFSTANMNKIEDGIEANDSAISEILGNIYPVGSIIIRDSSTDMSNWLGFTWEKVFAGKVLVGVDTTDTDFNAIGKTGGEKTHTLTIDEMPKHNHGVSFSAGNGVYNTAVRGNGSDQEMGSAKTTVSETGGGQSHNNLQPYQVVAYWKRTA